MILYVFFQGCQIITQTMKNQTFWSGYFFLAATCKTVSWSFHCSTSQNLGTKGRWLHPKVWIKTWEPPESALFFRAEITFRILTHNHLKTPAATSFHEAVNPSVTDKSKYIAVDVPEPTRWSSYRSGANIHWTYGHFHFRCIRIFGYPKIGDKLPKNHTSLVDTFFHRFHDSWTPSYFLWVYYTTLWADSPSYIPTVVKWNLKNSPFVLFHSVQGQRLPCHSGWPATESAVFC